jgi:polyferredoxin
MVKIGKPKGLIRYSSYTAIKDGVLNVFTPRIAGYSVVLTALVSLLLYFIITRADIDTTVLKAPGTLYSKTEDGQITNVYNIEFVNKTFDDVSLDVRVESPEAASLLKIGDQNILVPKEGILKGLFMIKLPEEEIKSMKMNVVLGIYQDGKKIESANARFIGPIKTTKN